MTIADKIIETKKELYELVYNHNKSDFLFHIFFTITILQLLIYPITILSFLFTIMTIILYFDSKRLKEKIKSTVTVLTILEEVYSFLKLLQDVEK